MFLSLCLSLIFFILGVLHIYWALGGNWGLELTVPTTLEGERVLYPSKTACWIVGLGLGTFGFFYILKGRFVDFEVPSWMLDYTGWGIMTLFFLRALGDFKYIGFFKHIKNTPFGKRDTLLFSPLSLGIALLGLLIELS
ncbi:DUF3995 domain-containing protein [Spongiimicrobium sp. 2-473A-2-J]|uniref:DUF3995 domain-containing protein n=1 Tax=Eudoraea algarum TaxID=3417568 RepID=UPI003D36C4D4